MVASVACVEVQYVVAAGGVSIVTGGWAVLAAARGPYGPRKQQEEPSFENFWNELLHWQLPFSFIRLLYIPAAGDNVEMTVSMVLKAEGGSSRM
jgi:hypothetical protein